MRFTTIIWEKWEKSKWWPVFLWSLLIFLGSSLPQIKVTADTLLDFVAHKSVHFFEYAVLAWLTWRAARRLSFSLLYPIFYALTDEFHQLSVLGRQSRWQDVVWDGFAAVSVNLLVYFCSCFKKRRRWEKEGLSDSVKETYLLAKRVLSSLEKSNLVALYGDLGSGKTTFVQGLTQALGVQETVSSPSFVLVKEYLLPEPVGDFKKLVHVDLYRLTSGEGVQALLLEELVADKSNLVVVEWAERWEQLPQRRAVRIYLSYVNERRRRWQLKDKRG